MNYDNNSEYSDNISDIKFIQVTINESNCNVNRDHEKINLLTDFSDTIPKYDQKNGLHLELHTKKISEPTIVPLNGYIASNMLIENSKKMENDEYFTTFVERKKEFVEKNIISQTFARGFERPSAVQTLTIPELIQGRDAMVQFKSGTGKTHAFLFGCLWGFDPNDEALQHIFVTSSHEVALQIYDQAKFLLPKNAKVVLCIGQKKDTNVSGGFKTPIGTSTLNVSEKSIKEQREETKKAQVIVCTLGKFHDLFLNKRWMNVEYLKTFCVDEFDAIVASKSRSKSSTIMTTEEQMAGIIKNIPASTQRIFFSATVSQQALQIAHSYFRKYDPKTEEPFIVLVDIEDYTLEGIRQYYVNCSSSSEKKDVLLDLLKQCRISQGIIFTNKIDMANEIKNFLDEQEVPISSAVFHAGLPAIQRNKIHKDFLDNKTRLLISTDLTARGFDVQGINVVINFDMPDTLETYIHRVGRTGRYGRKGVAISLPLVNSIKDETKKVAGINECSKNSQMVHLPNDLANLL